MRCWGSSPPSPFGLWRGSLRSLRYEGLPGLAQPKLAKRAKAGGARRDRTADLLHAMQALSQLSYGPLRIAAPESACGHDAEPQFRADLKSLRRLRHHR